MPNDAILASEIYCSIYIEKVLINPLAKTQNPKNNVDQKIGKRSQKLPGKLGEYILQDLP